MMQYTVCQRLQVVCKVPINASTEPYSLVPFGAVIARMKSANTSASRLRRRFVHILGTSASEVTYGGVSVPGQRRNVDQVTWTHGMRLRRSYLGWNFEPDSDLSQHCDLYFQQSEAEWKIERPDVVITMGVDT
jgi:hypothetical protein